MDIQPPDTIHPAARSGASLRAPATRREVLLFGLLILAVIWLAFGQKPRTVIVIPDGYARVGIIT